jgi:hypothetical protein
MKKFFFFSRQNFLILFIHDSFFMTKNGKDRLRMNSISHYKFLGIASNYEKEKTEIFQLWKISVLYYIIILVYHFLIDCNYQMILY